MKHGASRWPRRPERSAPSGEVDGGFVTVDQRQVVDDQTADPELAQFTRPPDVLDAPADDGRRPAVQSHQRVPIDEPLVDDDPLAIGETGAGDEPALEPVPDRLHRAKVWLRARRRQRPPAARRDRQRPPVTDRRQYSAREPGAEALEVEPEVDALGRSLDDLGQTGPRRIRGQQLPALPEPSERPQDLAVPNLEPIPEEVHVELDRVDDARRSLEGGDLVAGTMSDPFHGTTHTHDADADASRDSVASPWYVEVGITVAGAAVYFGGRVIVEGDSAQAVANAERLQRFERAVDLDVERSVQSWVIEHDLLRIVGNLSYVWLHWPLLVGVFVLLYARDRVRFRRLRTAMFLSGAVGLVIFATVPVAPPRFMPGFVGTVSDQARRHYIDYPLSWTNQFAALPSFHVGWTLVACLALAGLVGRRAGKAIALAPALLVAISVVTTGNHYVVDATVGTIIAVAAYAIAFRREPGTPETPRTPRTPIVRAATRNPAGGRRTPPD